MERSRKGLSVPRRRMPSGAGTLSASVQRGVLRERANEARPRARCAGERSAGHRHALPPGDEASLFALRAFARLPRLGESTGSIPTLRRNIALRLAEAEARRRARLAAV